MSTSPNLHQINESEIKDRIAKAASASAQIANDDIARKEEQELVYRAEKLGTFNPKTLAQYHYLEHVEKSDIRIGSLEKELKRLRPIEIEHARLSESKRKSRWMSIVSLIGIVVGGALISSFANDKTDEGWMWFGWGVISLSLLCQIFNLSTD